MTDNQNPISPHLQIYRWHISSLLSITHRITGVINLLALILMFVWILTVSFGEKNYEHGSKDKIGVLLTNLGTPDAPDAKSLRIYLNQFLRFLLYVLLRVVLFQN